MTGCPEFAFDVALSFAGEDRAYVDGVAERLRARGVRVFYDRYAVVDTWGADLYELFDEVFRTKARFAVVFVSRSYVGKPWPTHERRSAQARALTEFGPYLLPVRLDDAELPGLRPTVGYVDARQLTPDSLTDLVCQKLASADAAPSRPVTTLPPPPAHPPPPPPTAWTGPRRPRPRTLQRVLRQSWDVVFVVAVLALVPGGILATYSFETTPDSLPAGQGFGLILRITAVTGIAAVLVSWVYDIVSWRQRADDFALTGWPWWHRILVAAAALGAPVAALVLHTDAIDAATARLPAEQTPFFPWGSSTPYGPPLYFWWLAPSAMLAAHVLCLTIRYVRRSRATRS